MEETMAAAGAHLPPAIREHTYSVLHDLCAISSASGDGAGLKRLADRLGDELGRHLAAEVVHEQDSHGKPMPVLIARGPRATDGGLLVVGHLDTVLPAVAPRREGDRLFATGALDMKGGLATLVAALDLLAERGQPIPADLIFVGVPDEEVEGVISEAAVRHWGSGSRAMLVIEPGERRGNAETLVAGRRGLTEWQFSVEGTPAHSGLAYWQGRSALVAASAWCVRAQKMSRPGPHVTVNVARIVGGDRDFVLDLGRHNDLLGTSRRRNIVSDRAVAEGEIRFLSRGDRDRALARLQRLTARIAAEHGVAATLTTGVSVPPVDPHGPGEALVQRTVGLAAARGWALEVEVDRGGISFPNYLLEPGKLAVIDGLGPVGDGMHVREEFLDLRSLERRSVLLADLLATL
jgi:glutamate carboxypeptidase